MTEQTTKDRLLDAAEELFALRGYDGVSIREIAGAADVNVAAVNYHFHGKLKLYLEVLLRRLAPKRKRLLAALDEVEAASDDRPKIDLLIRAVVGAHLEDALGSPRGIFGIHLMSREMSEPRQGARVLVDEFIKPVRSRMLGLLGEYAPGLDVRQHQMIIGSIVGQIVFFAMYWHNHQPHPEKPQDAGLAFVSLADNLEDYIEIAIDHIARFSLGGIREILEGGQA